MTIIQCQALSKVYTVSDKASGLKGTLDHFWRRKYRQIPAVQDVSFEIRPGEVVGFLGPNGAGKTTTLKMLTGLIHPTAGHLTVAGQIPYQRRPSFLKQITLVMGQKQQLIWDLPAWDSLRINAAVYELSERECLQRVGELAEMLDLGDKLRQPVRKLSLGERMKAELLAALLHRPQILFLDEPTLGLDVNAQMSVRAFLKTYNEHFQATILLTSHYMADITALCERVLLIHQGELIYDGQLDDLLDKFSPYRQVKLELNQSVPASELQQFGDIEAVQERDVRLIVRREHLTETVSKILAQLDVCDLTITDPPIEEVIGRVFLSLDQTHAASQ
ncbi:ATP-binding cassette domain-containing protein [Thermosynechococcaceae cyanobacterium BACA0444]|uniref:ATP-binding cassette domain-containing protein n=1 Tax=Pseudocalidococcus azoricus BACA0444 TaxID=2918990 RepID=A0AAE4FUP0_9CYAN|nr:ATP-binding cassette domain-containing protein [Pseudocalidococcus azoricus]MDS3862223.1 ATP-binding cassette domain-containing protein [Pseudocalidococcus azoricus BACA0444]